VTGPPPGRADEDAIVVLSTGTTPSRLQVRHLTRSARGRSLRWVEYVRDFEADFGWRLVADRPLDTFPDDPTDDGSAADDGNANDGGDPNEGGDATGGGENVASPAGAALVAPVPALVQRPTRTRVLVTHAQSVARVSVKRVAGPVKWAVSVLPQTWQDRLQTAILGQPRGRGATPGKRLSDALLAGPLLTDRPALVVAVDRAMMAAAWYTVAEHPQMTALSGVDPAVRYLDIAHERAAPSLHWLQVVGGDEDGVLSALASLDPHPPRVVIVDPGADDAGGSPSALGKALLRAAGDAGSDLVLLRPAEPGLPFLTLHETFVTVRVPAPPLEGEAAPDSGHADPDPWQTLVAELAPDLVVDAPPVGRWDGVAVVAPEPAAVRAAVERLPGPAATAGSDDRRTHLLIAPANYAGQSAAWARAVTEHPQSRPGAAGTAVTARNLSVARADAPFAFPADYPLTATEWQRPQVRVRIAVEAVLPATHVLVEAMRPVLATGCADRDVNAWDFSLGRQDVAALARSGRTVGLVFHGSEVRRPDRHADEYEFSPFRDPAMAAATARLVEATRRVHKLAADFDGPVFVSTLDLLDDVPAATWLPVVVGGDCFRPAPLALRRRRPVVVHAPSSPFLKGTATIDRVLARLDQEGLIEYRRLDAVPSAFVGDFIREADVVVDQIVLGNPGVLATESLAAGRLVVAHVAEHVRRRFPSPPPIVEATPATIEDVLRSVCREPDAFRDTAGQGPDFAERVHSGRLSAAVLEEFLDS
jgi:hypothetical protein